MTSSEVVYKTCKRGHLKTPDNTTPTGRCRECCRETQRRWIVEHPLARKEHDRRSYIKLCADPSTKKKIFAAMGNNNFLNKKNVGKSYVANLLRLPVKQLPEELYQLKREQILLNRELRKLTKYLKEILKIVAIGEFVCLNPELLPDPDNSKESVE